MTQQPGTEASDGEGPALQDVLALSHAHPLVLFDGVCGLCNRTVDFIIARDPAAHFRFVPCQSRAGTMLLGHLGLPTDSYDSFVLVDAGVPYLRSDGYIRICRQLSGRARLGACLRFLPRSLRDSGYDMVASRRHRLFGRHETCRVPTQEEAGRFIL